MINLNIPYRVNTDYDGLNQLSELYSKVALFHNDIVELDFKNTKWFDANLFSVLGIIIKTSLNNNCKVILPNVNIKIKEVMRKNGFNHLIKGYKEQSVWNDMSDTYNTTVKFGIWKYSQIKELDSLIENDLLGKCDMPLLSPLLKKEFKRSFIEIFSNGFEHGKTECVSVCGQYFPQTHNKRLDFCMSNIGTTIKQNVVDFLKEGIDINSNCIEWATQEGTTTRKDRTGGFGLYLLKEFILKNKGQIYICSDDEFWNLCSDGKIYTRKLSSCFNGTIVIVEFNMTDTSYYQLGIESPNMDLNTIF